MFSNSPNWEHLTIDQQIELIDALSHLVSADVPILNALATLHAMQTHTQPRRWIIRWAAGIEQGQSMADALLAISQPGDPGLLALIASGEQSGQLGPMLQRWVEHAKCDRALGQSIQEAMAYPLIVMVVAVALAWCILVWAIPEFKTLFDDVDAPLPTLTRWVMWLSSQATSAGLSLPGLMVLLSLPWVYFMTQRPQGIVLRQRLSQSLPILGGLIQAHRMTLMIQQLSMLLAADLPLTQSLAWVRASTPMRAMGQSLARVETSVSSGHSMAQAMSQSGAFPAVVVSLCALGEQSGDLSGRLAHAAQMLQDDVNHRLALVSKLLEPFMMIMVGVGVGGLLLAVYMPLLSLTSLMG